MLLFLFYGIPLVSILSGLPLTSFADEWFVVEQCTMVILIQLELFKLFHFAFEVDTAVDMCSRPFAVCVGH